jgi:hypothetical protein
MKTLVLLLVIVFSLASSGPLKLGRLEKEVDGKPLDPLQRLHGTARLLNARVFPPLGGAAASRLEGGERDHRGADISFSSLYVKMQAEKPHWECPT